MSFTEKEQKTEEEKQKFNPPPPPECEAHLFSTTPESSQLCRRVGLLTDQGP